MSFKKKIQYLSKLFVRYIFKLIYGRINYKHKYNSKEIHRSILHLNKTKNIILKIKNARIYTDYVQHLAIIHNNNLLDQVSYQLKDSSLLPTKKNTTMEIGTPKILKKFNGNILSLVNGASGNDNYFHWLFDILPRLVMLDKINELKNIDYFYLPELKKFQIQTLKTFGINEKQFINSKKFRHVSADQIYATSHPWHKKGNILRQAQNIPNWVFHEITKKLISHKKQFNCSNKIFIDRRESKFNHCQIINDNEIKNFLVNKGFSVYRVGEIDLFKQFYLFNNAKIIVGAHGAAFANLIFCKKNTKVIEFFPKRHPNLVNKKISLIKNLKYKSLRSNNFNYKYNLNGDILVDLKKLNKLINWK